MEIFRTRLFRRTAGGVAFHQEQLGHIEIGREAIGELARQRRTAAELLAFDLLGAVLARLRRLDGEIGNALSVGHVLHQPLGKGIFSDGADQGGGLARAQALLGLAGELRVVHLEGQHVTRHAPHVLGRELDAARQQAAEFAELAQGVGESLSKTVDVCAVLHGRDEIHVTFHERAVILRRPHDGPVELAVVILVAPYKRVGGHEVHLVDLAEEIILEAVFVIPLRVVLFIAFIGETDIEAGAQHRLGAQHVLQARHIEIRCIEKLFIRPKVHPGAAVARADAAGAFQLHGLLPAGEGHFVFLAAALDRDLELLGKGVHHRYAHAVQAAGK